MDGLRTALQAYGRLCPNGLILKQQRGKDSYAFVDFEDPAAAQVGETVCVGGGE